jgi:RNA-directed DNA polymerase
MYDSIISLENLLDAWKDFIKGKRAKDDVQKFQYQLADNILSLHNDLKNKTYIHGGYYAFNISDPKPRNIHKASVRDRLLHHAIYRNLYPMFDKKFIHDSYSCRKFKGTHVALERFKQFTNTVTKNNTKTVWVLKCDIRKFFASVDQNILLMILEKHGVEPGLIDLIKRVTDSFESTEKGKGLPLGNLTSQLLVNIYMNEFDQYVKHIVKAKYYIRYADDFVFLSQDKSWLLEILPKINAFLFDNLSLTIHPNKLHLKTFASGVDFLGWVHFPDHKVLRTATKQRMFTKLKNDSVHRLHSYLGMLSHGNTQGLQKLIKNINMLY